VTPETRTWNLGALVLLALRWGMAAVFIAAAIPKIAAPDLFAGNVHNYQILPAWGVNVLAIVLPWLELLSGVGLALGIWSRACAVTMAALLLVFTSAYVSARVRGLDIACGCFEVGSEAEPASALWIALRDLALLLAAGLLAWFDGGPRPWAVLQRLFGRKARAGVSLR
jgi:uncharacterized membrane protein YphA (DoxX/SURF4 family)